MYDHELTLIRYDGFTYDNIGNQIPNEVKSDILCRLKSVSGNEFYNAAMTGLKPEMVFVIHLCEYNGEQVVEFEGARYKVLRTYRGGMARQGSKLNFDEMELTCERVSTDG